MKRNKNTFLGRSIVRSLKKAGFLSSCLLMTMFLLNCTSDLETSKPSSFDGGPIYDVNLSSNVRLDSSDLTESNNEIRLDDVAVLVFDKQDKFLYRALVKDKQFDEQHGVYHLKFQVNKSLDKSEFNLVFIANQRLDNTLSEYKGKAKSEVLSKMTFSSLDNDGAYKWGFDKNTSIPMWGESKAVLLDQSKVIIEDVLLMRSIARVDFGFNFSVDELGQEKWTPLTNESGKEYALSSIYVNKAIKSGLIAPKDENLALTGFEVSKPTLPAGAGMLKPLHIQLDDFTKEPVKRKVYLLENNGGTFDQNKTSLTSFVIGLHNESLSNIVNGKETNIRYFRVDLADDGQTNIQSVLRNMRYVVSIEKIYGTGFDTPEEAEKRQANVLVNLEVKPWEAEEHNSTLGEQVHERLSIPNRVVETSHEVNKEGSIEFWTNIPEEKIKLTSSEEGYFDYSLEKISDSEDKDQYRISIVSQQDNFTKDFRESKLTLNAGHMKVDLDARQLKYKFEVDSISNLVPHGRYIKDWNIQDDRSWNGKNEFLTFNLHYRNDTFNQGDDNKYKVRVVSDEAPEVYFEGDFTLPEGVRKGILQVKLKAFGKPASVGNKKFTVRISDLIAEVDGNERDEIKLQASVAFTYRSLNILSLGKIKYAFAPDNLSGKMLMETGSFGRDTLSLFKVQRINISLEAKKRKKTLQNELSDMEEFVKKYDLVYISEGVDTYDKIILNGLNEYINRGGFVVETNRAQSATARLMDLVFDNSQDPGNTPEKQLTIELTRKSGGRVFVTSQTNSDWVLKSDQYDLRGKLLRAPWASQSTFEDLAEYPEGRLLNSQFKYLQDQMLILGYVKTRDTETLTIDGVVQKDAGGKDVKVNIYYPGLIRHKTKGFIWCGDPRLVNSYTNAYQALNTINNQPTTFASNYTPNKGEPTYNAALLYNMIRYIIPFAHENKTNIENLYTYGFEDYNFDDDFTDEDVEDIDTPAED